MPASRAIPSRFFLPLLLFVPVALALLPVPAASRVPYPEVVSQFDEFDPPAVRHVGIPVPWRDDVFEGSAPSLPWIDDESFRRARVSRVDTREKRPVLPWVFHGRNGNVSPFALHRLANPMILCRPPPQAAPCAG